MRDRALVLDFPFGKTAAATLCAATALICLAAVAAPASAQDVPAAAATPVADAPATAATAPAPATPPPARFNMIQNGKKMTADDFDAWMKGQGYQSPNRPETDSAPAKTVVAQAEPLGKKVAGKKVVAAVAPKISFADVSAKVVSAFADVTANGSFRPRAD